jgi:hypothetical protein
LASPALWPPAQPNLYRCSVTVKSAHGEQQVERRFGLRWFEFPKHGSFQLNGDKLFLRGGDRHARRHSEAPDTILAKEVRFRYQTEKLDKPPKFAMEETAREGNVATLEARLLDAKGVQCLDARNAVHFAIAGDGESIRNPGTSTGSRQVGMYNGRAIIRARMKKGQAAVSVSAEKLPTALLTILG